jgi:glucose-1-phosphate cytidylyltransferase
MTGGRIKRIHQYVKNEEAFCLTYGDGLADVNIRQLIAFHNQNHYLATVTAAHPPGRFGAMDIQKDGVVRSFTEKPKEEGAMINGGFFVLSPKVIELITADDTIWEREPLEQLARANQLRAFEHQGFWQPMDTLRDKNLLEDLWNSGRAPWKVWQ